MKQLQCCSFTTGCLHDSLNLCDALTPFLSRSVGATTLHYLRGGAVKVNAFQTERHPDAMVNEDQMDRV